MHYLVIRGESIEDVLLFRNIFELMSFLLEDPHCEQLIEVYNYILTKRNDEHLFCSVIIDGVEWQFHCSDPSEEPAELKFYYETPVNNKN